MKTQIYKYKINIIGKKEESYEISQEQGQKTIMALAVENPPKFIVIDGNAINTSVIGSVDRFPSKTYSTDGRQVLIPEVRELTESEAKINDIFEKFTNNKKLLS